MRTLLVVVLLLPLLCLAASTAKDLEGDWVVDTDATWTLMQENPQMKAQFGSMPPEQQVMIKNMVMGKMAKMNWTLKDGQAQITEPDGAVRTSTWSVAKVEGGTFTIDAKDDQGAVRTGTLTVNGEHLIARGFSEPGKNQVQPDTAVVMKRSVVAAAPAAAK